MRELLTPQEAHEKAERFFDELWQKGDYWGFESSDYEEAKYASQLEILPPGGLGRVLELGCGAGHFTRKLATRASHVVGVDISATAVERARESTTSDANIRYLQANIMHLPLLEGDRWDLVVFSETMYYIGWLYSFFDAGMLASRIFASTASGGMLLMCNTLGEGDDWLLHPVFIRTYRDLFVNAGFTVKHETVFRGQKQGSDFEALITLAVKA